LLELHGARTRRPTAGAIIAPFLSITSPRLGHTTFDVTVGKNFGERFSLGVSGINVANRRALLDNSFTFGGTHYMNPREIFVQLRYRFHYSGLRRQAQH
jgi:outer membrane receptor protein involved in Fe transport